PFHDGQAARCAGPARTARWLTLTVARGCALRQRWGRRLTRPLPHARQLAGLAHDAATEAGTRPRTVHPAASRARRYRPTATARSRLPGPAQSGCPRRPERYG